MFLKITAGNDLYDFVERSKYFAQILHFEEEKNACRWQLVDGTAAQDHVSCAQLRIVRGGRMGTL
jgi:hypothetical protein